MAQLTDKELALSQIILNRENGLAGVAAGVVAMLASVLLWGWVYKVYAVATLVLILFIGAGIGLAVRAAGRGHSKQAGLTGMLCTACALLLGGVEFGVFPRSMVLFPIIVGIGGLTAGFQAARQSLPNQHRRMVWKAINLHGVAPEGRRNDPKLIRWAQIGVVVFTLAILGTIGGLRYAKHSAYEAEQAEAFGFIFDSDEFAEHAREKGRELGMTMSDSECRAHVTRRLGRCGESDICIRQNPFVLEGCLELALPDELEADS